MLRVVESLKHNFSGVSLYYFVAMILWWWMVVYLCLLFINIAAVVSEKKFRTRFTCNRPTRDNISSILFDKSHDDNDDDVSYNHGKNYLAYCIIMHCSVWLCGIKL